MNHRRIVAVVGAIGILAGLGAALAPASVDADGKRDNKERLERQRRGTEFRTLSLLTRAVRDVELLEKKECEGRGRRRASFCNDVEHLSADLSTNLLTSFDVFTSPGSPRGPVIANPGSRDDDEPFREDIICRGNPPSSCRCVGAGICSVLALVCGLEGGRYIAGPGGLDEPFGECDFDLPPLSDTDG